jgi:hypothetical protein
MIQLLFTLGLSVTAPAPTEQEVADGILWLVTPEKWDSLRPYRGTRAATDGEYRLELARAFIAAAERFDLPVYLLVVIGYRESVFRPELAGDQGRSLGLMQVGRQGRRRCKEHCQNPHSVDGGAMCGACWLSAGRDWCGSVVGGLMAYCSGKCKSETPRSRRAMNAKLRLWVAVKVRGNEKGN